MKKLHRSFLATTIFLSLGMMILISCGNSAQKTQNSTSDSLTAVNTFKDKVHRFDSSWKDRLQMLDTRIHEYDSSANTYKGSLHDKMEKQLKKIKAERDSLAKSLDQVQDQGQEKWQVFQKKVSDQYSTVVQSLTDLRNLNQ